MIKISLGIREGVIGKGKKIVINFFQMKLYCILENMFSTPFIDILNTFFLL